MFRFIKKQKPVRIIAVGFLSLILIGSGLLMLPCCVKPGVTLRYIDSLYTSASAVCVTGLVTVDPRDTFTAFGQFVLGALMQVGGLGVTSVGAGVMLVMRKKMGTAQRMLVREGSNLSSGKGIVRFVYDVFITTVIIELLGAVLSLIVFWQDFPPLRAIGVSLFHSVAAFNNSGFDILGNMQSLTPYRDNVLLNLITCVLVFFGGVGFLVIREVIDKRFRWKRYSMHTKVVLAMSAVLTLGGALLLKLTGDFTWLGALFNSVTARTAGFSTYPLSGFTNAGLIIMMVLMIVGASPGSTGGGIKTTTLFVLLRGIKASATNETEKAFRYSLPKDAFRKAAVITSLAIGAVITGTFLLVIFEPQLGFSDAAFEMVSAFGTVGLSTGITTSLGVPAKLLSMVMMYIGRLGPLTVASLWYFTNGERVSYPQGNITIG